MKVSVRVNDQGRRIGESHPHALLSDADVELLLVDRGPSHAPLMSLGALSLKWGMSKSGVKSIVDGTRRGQVGPRVEKAPTRKVPVKKVRVNLNITLHARAKLHRLGGGEWLERALSQA